MPIPPKQLTSGTDEDASQSGIFTSDGQSFFLTTATNNSNTNHPHNLQLSQVMMESDRIAAEFEDTVDFDNSLVSGINEQSYRAKLRAEENLVRAEYSLDDSTIEDNNNNIMGESTYRGGGSLLSSINGGGILNQSVNQEANNHHPSDDLNQSTDSSSIFNGNYSRIMNSFFFPSSRSGRQQPVRTQSGTRTPQTASPTESQKICAASPKGSLDNDDDEESRDNAPANRGRPRTIVLAKAPKTPADQKTKATSKNNTPTTEFTGSTIYQETKIFGMSLKHFLILVVLIMLASVAVAIGTAVASQKSKDESSDSSAFRDVVIGSTTTANPVQTPLTITPTMAPMVSGTNPAPTTPEIVSTLAPVVVFRTNSPIAETVSPDSSTDATTPPVPLPGPTGMPILTTDAPTGSPSASSFPTTETPTGAPSVFAVGLCGGDDDDTTFEIFDVVRTCAWFRRRTSSFINYYCDERFEPFWICRETCQNCLPPPTGTPTIAPTGAPISPTISPAPTFATVNVTSIRETVLEGAPLSTMETITAGNSAQGRALDWLLSEEEFVLTFSARRIQQIFAVAVFAYATNLDGPNGWLNSYDECSFAGIECTNGRVVQISVSGRSRVGRLPEEFGMLSSMVSFDGRLNDYEGPIPTTIGLLTELVTLQLSQNSLTGNLPSSMADMSSLQNLFLDGNNLSGDFPNEVLAQMSSLDVVSLYDNRLEGEIAEEVCELALGTLITDCDITGCYTGCVS